LFEEQGSVFYFIEIALKKIEDNDAKNVTA
jgi:hypothetical protein